ncbi:hypothetical protein KIPB_010344, partial [Kipferlia bialata]
AEGERDMDHHHGLGMQPDTPHSSPTPRCPATPQTSDRPFFQHRQRQEADTASLPMSQLSLLSYHFQQTPRRASPEQASFTHSASGSPPVTIVPMPLPTHDLSVDLKPFSPMPVFAPLDSFAPLTEM